MPIKSDKIVTEDITAVHLSDKLKTLIEGKMDSEYPFENEYLPKFKTGGKIYILVGLIGSGKTTWAKNFVEDNLDTKIVSADGFRTMFNGTYKHLEELDDVIDRCIVAACNSLIETGYNVILDMGNLTRERRETWTRISAKERIAVIFPLRDKVWHVQNRLKNPHSDINYGNIFDIQIKAYQPVQETEFDKVIRVI